MDYLCSHQPSGMPRTLLFLLGLLLTAALSAQGLRGARNEDRAVLIQIGYGPFTTSGDLSDRFGNGFNLDGGATWLLEKSNWEFGLRANFGFGNDVREDPLARLRTRDGFLIGNQREPADIQLRHRQLFVGASVGYTIAIGKNKRTGIALRTSPGYFYHQIRIQDDVVQAVPQLSDDLLPGYDRLTGGFAVHQFLGYQSLGTDRKLNFYLGAEAIAGFTKALRNFNYTTGLPSPTAGRTDIVLGLKAGIILPLYVGEGREIFY